jgi:probable phosphoglycerate mutase
LGLIRHAQTQWNRQKRIQGQLDSPLTDKGIEQARHWGRLLARFAWDACICSDLGRAAATAGYINAYLKVPISHDPRLREQDWGRWTGRTLAGLEKTCPEVLADQVARGWSFCPPDGEARLAVYKRGRSALVEAAHRHEGGTVLIVAHEGLLKCVLYRCLGRQFLPSETAVLKSCHLHWIACDQATLSIDRLNALNLDRS